MADTEIMLCNTSRLIALKKLVHQLSNKTYQKYENKNFSKKIRRQNRKFSSMKNTISEL